MSLTRNLPLCQVGFSLGEGVKGTESEDPAWGLANLRFYPRERMLLVGGESPLWGPGKLATALQLHKRVYVRSYEGLPARLCGNAVCKQKGILSETVWTYVSSRVSV